MFETSGYSRFLNLQGSKRLWVVGMVGTFISILFFFVFNDLTITITLLLSTFVGIYLLSIKPKEIDIEITSSYITIDENSLDWTNCVEWGAVVLGDFVEIVIRTDKYNHQFYYFYMERDDIDTKETMRLINENLPYNSKTSSLNPIHIILRNIGLK